MGQLDMVALGLMFALLAGTTPRPNEKGELPALLSAVRVLHFTELHGVSVVRSWCSLAHPGRPTGNQMPVEEANCHELVFSCYKKVLCLCLKVPWKKASTCSFQSLTDVLGDVLG